MRRMSTKDIARGHWRKILPAVGLPMAILTGKHQSCPICGGVDRFRFDDKDSEGGYFCSNRECGPGDGFQLVMRFHGINFTQARAMVMPHCTGEPAITTKPDYDPKRNLNAWQAARPLTGQCPASLYLRNRGLRQETWNALRYVERQRYRSEDGKVTHHPAMLARYVAPDASESTVHCTYIDHYGSKAKGIEPRKMFPGPVPKGGAVRLYQPAAIMGVAEGIETAIAASQMFNMPVWSVLSSANLIKWTPPPIATTVFIFGDNDESFGGQHAAYTLAYRLKQSRLRVEVQIPEIPGTDWNDVVRDDVEETSDVSGGEALPEDWSTGDEMGA